MHSIVLASNSFPKTHTFYYYTEKPLSAHLILYNVITEKKLSDFQVLDNESKFGIRRSEGFI